ncbi:MAG: hypothetical protein IK093_05120 [Ruminiclostridium sp.]|nr:hypothetical protein [Ruminiclostridium sp.]
MKTSKELFERLRSDEAFAKDFSEVLTAKRENGANNCYEAIIPAAAGFGYELTKEELDEIINAQDSELSADELGKAAGGTSCLAATVWVGIGILALPVVSAGVTIAIKDD